MYLVYLTKELSCTQLVSIESPWPGDSDSVLFRFISFGQWEVTWHQNREHGSKSSQNSCFALFWCNYAASSAQGIHVDSKQLSISLPSTQLKSTYDAWKEPSSYQQLQVDVCGSSHELSFISEGQSKS